MGIRIDEELRRLIPPLAPEEYAGLEESIAEEGRARDAIVLWGDIIVDGHNRYEICTRLGLPFDTARMEFEDRNAAKLWMMKNQLARRNLNDFQRIEIVRWCEGAVRAKAKERQGARTDIQNIVEKFPESRARDELGLMAGVSGKTYEHAVAVLDKAPEPVADAVRRDELSINAAYQVTKMEPEQQEEVASRIGEGESAKAVVDDVKKRPHVSFNSGNNEWYTPADYIELARQAMGGIDLDPASSDIANETVGATVYYTAEDNGLEKSWSGRVWMNPPYASELIGKFADKLIQELDNIHQAVVLVNNATETEWFGKLVDRASAVCFPHSRIKFYMPDGKTGAPLQGQAILYYGENTDGFIKAFKAKGWCAVPK